MFHTIIRLKVDHWGNGNIDTDHLSEWEAREFYNKMIEGFKMAPEIFTNAKSIALCKNGQVIEEWELGVDTEE